MAPTAGAHHQMLACFEDSSFIYRHRKRPRSEYSAGASPYQNSPASSTATNSTTDSMLSTSSGDSSGRSSSSSLSPPPLLDFNLASPAGDRKRPQPSFEFSASPVAQTTSGRRSTSSLGSSLLSSECMSSQETDQRAILRLQSDDCAGLDGELDERPDALGYLSASSRAERELEGQLEEQAHERAFLNLILRERRMAGCQAGGRQPVLTGQLRHSLLSWMLRICEHQLCQDEIFPLATMILDSFLHLNPIISNPSRAASQFDEEEEGNSNQDDECLLMFLAGREERELEQRQLLLFAACSLLLATKLRQTPRLYIQTLIEFSSLELPIELGRDEIIDAELLMLTMLKWDLAALVTPNEFLQELLARKCPRVLTNFLTATTTATSNSADDSQHPRRATTANSTDNKHTKTTGKLDEGALHQPDRHQDCRHQANPTPAQSSGDFKQNKCKLVNRVTRHTQTLLELCFMDSQLSQYPPSVLAMASMAVAIDGLSKTKNTCWALREIVEQLHESTNKINELEQMIDVAFQIEKYVQTLLQTTTNDDDD